MRVIGLRRKDAEKKADTHKNHYPCIPIQEMPQFVKDMYMNKARLYPTTVNVMKFVMLTFVRTGELIYVFINEFDFDIINYLK
jgi:hypothetical protein